MAYVEFYGRRAELEIENAKLRADVRSVSEQHAAAKRLASSLADELGAVAKSADDYHEGLRNYRHKWQEAESALGIYRGCYAKLEARCGELVARVKELEALVKYQADTSAMKSKAIGILEADAAKADAELDAWRNLLPGVDPSNARIKAHRATVEASLGYPCNYVWGREITISA